MSRSAARSAGRRPRLAEGNRAARYWTRVAAALQRRGVLSVCLALCEDAGVSPLIGGSWRRRGPTPVSGRCVFERLHTGLPREVVHRLANAASVALAYLLPVAGTSPRRHGPATKNPPYSIRSRSITSRRTKMKCKIPSTLNLATSDCPLAAQSRSILDQLPQSLERVHETLPLGPEGDKAR
jgi:hypothetical protein